MEYELVLLAELVVGEVDAFEGEHLFRVSVDAVGLLDQLVPVGTSHHCHLVELVLVDHLQLSRTAHSHSV